MGLPTPYYDEGGIALYNADCREVLPFLPKCDLLLTDPPYGIGESSKKQASRSVLASQRDYGEYEWDQQPPPGWLLECSIASSRSSVVWGGNYFALPRSSCWFVWDKDNGQNDFADCELAWTNLPKAVRRFKWRWQGMLQERGGDKKENRVHPTQKPVPLMQWCISHAGDVDTILDPFAGSGTTLVAAKLEGRRAIGIELEERYCEAAVKRLAQGVLSF